MEEGKTNGRGAGMLAHDREADLVQPRWQTHRSQMTEQRGRVLSPLLLLLLCACPSAATAKKSNSTPTRIQPRAADESHRQINRSAEEAQKHEHRG